MDEINDRPDLKHPARPRALSWLLIPLLLAAIVTLWIADVRVAWPLQPLNWLINCVSVALGVAFIIIPAARTVLANGQPSVLMLGCGMLIMDIGVAAMPVATGWSTSTGFEVYNTSVLLSALCHLAGVAITSWRNIRLRRASTWLTAAYAGGLAVMGLVIWGAMAGWMPAFFIGHYAQDPLRRAVGFFAPETVRSGRVVSQTVLGSNYSPFSGPESRASAYGLLAWGPRQSRLWGASCVVLTVERHGHPCGQQTNRSARSQASTWLDVSALSTVVGSLTKRLPAPNSVEFGARSYTTTAQYSTRSFTIPHGSAGTGLARR